MVDWLMTFEWLKLLVIVAAGTCGAILAILLWSRFRSKQRPPDLNQAQADLEKYRGLFEPEDQQKLTEQEHLVLRQRAVRAFNEGEIEEAERLLRQAIDLAPKASSKNKALEELAIVLTNKANVLLCQKPEAISQVKVILTEAVSLAPQVVDKIFSQQEEARKSSSSSLSAKGAPAGPARMFNLRDLYRSWFKHPQSSQPPSTVKSSPPPALLHQLRFSVFYPDMVKPQDTGKIIAYAHLENVAREVAREAAQRLGLDAEVRLKAASEPSRRPVPQESVIKVTPDIPGLRFDTPEAHLTLWEDKQSVEFRFRPEPTEVDRVCHGWLHFWLAGVLLADVRLSIAVVVEEAPDIFQEALAEANSRPYRFIFPSYSHEDAAVVARLEAYAQAFGDEYLRDVHKLRSGQHWHPELIHFIRQANVFQLFWSEKSAGSTYVQQEWQEALEQRRLRPDPHFLRPVYWTEKPAPIPVELQEIHFTRIPYAVLTE